MAKSSQEKSKTTSSDKDQTDVAALKQKRILTGADIVAIGEEAPGEALLHAAFKQIDLHDDS